jgi:hypothetical protein
MDNSEKPAESERRAQRRLKTALPMRVRGVDAQGTEFEESTETIEVSRRGLSFLTERELEPFATVTVLIPGRGPRHAGEEAADFFSTAAVIRIVKEVELYRVSLRFIGATLTTYSAETPWQDAEERY